MPEVKVNKGVILLAEPFLTDPNFRRSVVLLCEHLPEGSLGFILNKPLKMNVDGLIAGFPEFKAEVHFGGPVSTDTIHYIHNLGNLLEDSVEVSRGVYWGGDFEKLKFLIQSELVKPHNIRFFVGYSGWSPGLLSEEMGYGSWVVADMHANYIFKSHPASLWKQVMANKGKNFEVIAQMPDNINYN